MEYTKIIQLLGVDGNHVGLYGIAMNAPLGVTGNPQKYFDEALAVAQSRGQHYLESEYEEEINVQEEADDALALLGIHRLFVEECTTDVI